MELGAVGEDLLGEALFLAQRNESLGGKGKATELPSGIVAMGARVYDPYTGTFTQPDPIQGGGANAYGYTDGDPVNETDLSGREIDVDLGGGGDEGDAAGAEIDSGNGGGGAPQVNWAAQTKHFLGHDDYIAGRSQLSANPESLTEQAGSGDPVNAYRFGAPGFRERIDFSQPIGTHIDPDTGAESTTSKGVVHYSSRGVHIVPARP